jgi:hypothetical protein
MKVHLAHCNEYYESYDKIGKTEIVEINTMDELMELLRKNAKSVPDESGSSDRTWARIRYEKDSEGNEMVILIIVKDFVNDFLQDSEGEQWMKEKGFAQTK